MSRQNAESPTQLAPSVPRSVGDALAARMNGPGGYYNLGNVIGFVVGATQAVIAGGSTVESIAVGRMGRCHGTAPV